MENKLVRLSAAIQDLLRPLSVEKLAKLGVQSLLEVSGADFGTFWLYNHKKKLFETQQTTLPASLLRTVQADEALAKVLQTKKTLLMPKDEKEKDELYSRLLIPVLYNKSLIAVLGVDSKDTAHFNPEMIALLELYGAAIALAMSRAQLQEEEKAFISFASHELRNPLTPLNGYIQLLASKLANEQTPEGRWTRELVIESERLTNLIKKLLSVKP